jgi:hypothetical protein
MTASPSHNRIRGLPPQKVQVTFEPGQHRPL